MTDFKSAFNEGLNAAQKVKAARTEIDNVFKDLNQQLTEVSGGKLTIERERLARPQAFALLNPPQRYWALVARNPIIKSSSRELCEWDSGRAGYPCKLTWASEEHYCEDKEALKNNLSDLLRDPIIAEKMISLMDSTSTTK